MMHPDENADDPVYAVCSMVPWDELQPAITGTAIPSNGIVLRGRHTPLGFILIFATNEEAVAFRDEVGSRVPIWTLDKRERETGS